MDTKMEANQKRNTKNKTELETDPGKTQQEYIEMDPYIKHIKNVNSKKLCEFLQQNESPPDLYNMEERELRKITDIILQIPAQKKKIGKNTEKQQQNKQQETSPQGIIQSKQDVTYTCPTCTYKTQERHQLQKHRQMNPQCRPKWDQEYKQGWKCQNKNCTHVYNTEKNYKNTTNITVTPRKTMIKQKKT